MTIGPFPPWTLKGVDPESRNAAIKAAERAGRPVGAWVARVILEAAQRELTGSREVAAVPEAQPPAVAQPSPPAANVADLSALAEAAARVAAMPQDTREAKAFARTILRTMRRAVQ